MVQILPQAPSLAELLGGGVSQGMQTGLKTMMDRRQQQKSGSALSQVLGMPEMADQISQLPLDIQQQLTKGILDQKRQMMIQASKAPEQPRLSAPTTQYLKDFDKSVTAAENVLDVAKEIEQYFPAIAGATGTGQKFMPNMWKKPEVAAVQTLKLDLLNHYKSLFPRGLTQVEYKQLASEGLPELGLSEEANKLRLKKFVDHAQKIMARKKKFDEIREQHGYIPENISSLLLEKNEKENSPLNTETKVLTKEMAQKFLKAANSDKEKAREMAKKSGFNF